MDCGPICLGARNHCSSNNFGWPQGGPYPDWAKHPERAAIGGAASFSLNGRAGRYR